MRSGQVDMLHGSLWKKIILFALPIAFTNLLQQLFNSADVAVVGTLRVYGRTIMPTIIYVISICGVRIAWVYAIFRMWHEYNMLSWVYPVSWLVANIAVIIAYFLVIRKMKTVMPVHS